MEEEKGLISGIFRVSILVFLFTSTILFLSQGISSSAEGIKATVKEGAKETAEAISDTTKGIADEVRKKKRIFVEEIKKGW